MRRKPGIDRRELRTASMDRSNFRQAGIQENVDFVGRRTELAKMASQLRRGDVAITHAQGGKGGIGKTQLAVAYAFKHRKEYDGIWWLAADETRIEGSAGELARMLNPAFPKDISYTECCRLICGCLSDGRRHLLIIDNLEGADRFDAWRLADRPRLLVTTRLASVPDRRFHNLQITDLRRLDAIALLRKHRENLGDDKPLDALAEHLGDHALALALAGSYLAQCPDMSPKGLLDDLRTSDDTVLDDPEILKARDYARPVAETLMLHVPDDLGSSLRGRILSTAAFCHPDTIPVDLFEAVLGQTAAEIRKELATLKKLSVLQYSGDYVSLHWLTQAVLRARLTPEQRAAQIKVIRIAATEKFDYDIAADDKQWPEMRRWLPHVLAVLDRVPAERKNAEWAFVANQAGFFLNMQARRQAALRYLYKAEQIDRAALGDNHPDVARDVNNIGRVLRAQGKQDDLLKALDQFRKAKEIYLSEFGAKHPKVAMTLNNIGLILLAQGERKKREEALVHFRKARRIYSAVFGVDHPKVAMTLNNIGIALRGQNKFDKALVNLAEAERIDRHAFGNDHPNVARDANNIGITLWKHAHMLRQVDKLDKLEDVLVILRAAKRIYRRVFGDVHSIVAMTLSNIRLALRDQGKREWEKALDRLHDAERIYRAVFGDVHADVAMILNNIGLILEDQDKNRGAIESYRGAEKIWRQILGDKHPDLAICINNIGVLMQAERDFAGARKCYREALKIYRWNGYDKSHDRVRLVKENQRGVRIWRTLWAVW